MALRRPAETTETVEVAQRRYRRDAEGLAAQLYDADPAVRRWAVRDMVAHGAGTSDETVALLGRCVLHDHDERVRSALLNALASVGSAAAVTALLPLLRSDDAGLRNGAIEALACQPHTAAHIERLLRDADPDVRIMTITVLGDLRHDAVTTWLAQVLRDDDDVNVVAAAVEVMAEVGRPEDVAALLMARDRFAAHPFVGFAVDLATARIEQR